ncbi:MAG: uracil-DNA glycosylase [Puniceicoccaceae bacterium]|nr:MAG: uracil-DNA glycosylase [Puniceicoccaceae bacterium]
MIREALDAVIAELGRRERAGDRTVAVSSEVLEELGRALEKRPVPREKTAPAAPQAAPGGGSAAAPGPLADLLSTSAPAASGASAPPSAPRMEALGKPSEPIPPPPVIKLPEGGKQERWEWLRERVLGCPVCREHVHPGCQIVFGVGSLEAEIFFCGEAPGADEEVQGEPFVGRAGEMLTKIIRAMGLSREQVYIGNIMNWRPEMPTRIGNRPPTAEEMAFCLPYLQAQVNVVAPKVIVALGATAAKGLLGGQAFKSLGEIRGRWREFDGVPVMTTYHPSYLLRNNTNRTKRVVWEDMLAVMERVGLPISPRQREFFR